MRILLALFAAASAASASVPSDVMEFELGNGIRVISRQMPSTNEGLAVFLEGGSRTLDEGTAGIENLAFEACLMGSSRYPGEAWRSLMDVTQARIEGVYGYDFSALRLMCLEEDLPVLLDAMSDCLIDPELEASAFERTRDGLLQALLVEESDPDERVWRVANEGLFAGHPYRFDPSGTVETMEGFTAADVRARLSERMLAGNMLIAHVGPTGTDDLREMLEGTFGRIAPGGGDLTPPPPFVFSRDTVVFQPESTLTAYIVGKFPAPSPSDPDYPLFTAAMDAVSDRFWQVLRTERGLTYAPFAGAASSMRNWAYLYASTPEAAEACSLMAAIVLEGASGGFSDENLRGSLEVARTGRMMSLSSPFNQAYMLGMYGIETGDWRNLWLYSDIARDMDPAMLGEVLTRWLGPISWGLVGDPGICSPVTSSPPTITEGR